MKKYLSILIVTLSYSLSAQTETITLLQYNLMYYRAGSSPCTHTLSPTQRDNKLKDIVAYAQPHIFVVNELGSNPANAAFVKDFVLNINGNSNFRTANYSNNSFSSIRNMLFYDSSKVELHNQSFIDKDLSGSNLVRVIDLYRMYYKDSKFSLGADTVFFTVVVAHLKAGNSNSDALERLEATEALMSHLENSVSDNNVIFCGDFNIYKNSEPAFQKITNYTDASENFFDPINQLGNWNNNSNYAAYHTQSTHASSSGCFSGGGMDDRFDFILISEEIKNGTEKVKYIPNSYLALGQDGNHYNQSVNSGTNSSVPSSIANALYDFSDHLPVRMQIEITKSDIGLAENLAEENKLSNNNPISNELKLQFQKPLQKGISIKLISLTGKEVLKTFLNKGENKISLDTQNLPNGIYFLSIQYQDGSKIVKKIIKR